MFKTCLENRIILQQKAYKCYLCNYETPKNAFPFVLKHVEHQDHKEILDKKVNNEVRIKESEVLLTISESQRKKLVENGITLCETFDYYRCQFCKASCHGLISIFEHIKKSTHTQKVNKIAGIGTMFKTCLENRIIHRQKSYKCYLCHYDTPDNIFDSVLKHVKDPVHKRKLKKVNNEVRIKESKVLLTISESQRKKLVENGITLSETFDYYRCRYCNASNQGLISILEHIEKSTHIKKKEKVTRFISKESVSVKKKSNIKSDDDLRHTKDLLIIGPKYLSMCLESGKENIYNIDKEKLHLMQFGLSMMFLSEAESYCFACDFNVPYDYKLIYDHLTHEIHIENLNGLSKNHYQTEKETEFTYLDLANELMTEKTEEKIKCHACDEFILNSEEQIRAHKNLETHVSKCYASSIEIESVQKKFSRLYIDTWYYANKYYCNICNLCFTVEIKFARHLNDSEHTKKVQSLQTTNKENKVETKMNVCHSCSSCWFGEADFSKHQKDPNHINFKKKTTMFLPKITKNGFTLLNNIDNQVKNLIDESDKIAEQNVEKKLLKSIEETVKSIYANAKAYAFGSRSSYLGLNSSDVDVFLDCESNYTKIGSKEKSQKYICSVTSCFFSKGQTIWKKNSVLLHPRVPIIKLQHRETGIFCDISFLSGLGVEKTNLLKIYVLAYKHCREMILYLKKWFDAFDLYGAQAINAYAISWCVIFYLQIEGIFPSVYSIIKLKDQPNIVDGWECGFPETVSISCEKAAANKKFKELLKGFFSYYSKFNYQTSVVCPYLGTEIDKSHFVKNDLPQMNNYYNRLKAEDIGLFKFHSPMCIQDPVDHSQNITKAVTKFQLRRFRYYCSESSKKLEELAV